MRIAGLREVKIAFGRPLISSYIEQRLSQEDKDRTPDNKLGEGRKVLRLAAGAEPTSASRDAVEAWFSMEGNDGRGGSCGSKSEGCPSRSPS